jgi:hypothetical protein
MVVKLRIFEIVKNKVTEHINNINGSLVRNEFKLRVYIQYTIPALRYLFSVHELIDSQLTCLDHTHTNAIKSWLGVSKTGATPAILYSPDGLSFPKLSDMYLEAHTLSYARCLVKGDNRVVHALQCKLKRESAWKQKMKSFGSRRWAAFYQAACVNTSEDSPKKWNVVKDNMKQELKFEKQKEWTNYIQPLAVQGNMLKLIEAERSDLTWKSMIYNLPRGS